MIDGMDARLDGIVTRQLAARFAGLSGSDLRAVVRVSAALLAEVIAEYKRSMPAIRDLTVAPRAGNAFDVSVKLAKAPLLPTITLRVAVEKQPSLPGDATLVLHLSGGGPLMRFAGPALQSVGGLPPGIRLEGERLFIDIRAVARDRGRAELLDYAQDVAIATEEGTLIVLMHAAVP
jgi:hypothetical protein